MINGDCGMIYCNQGMKHSLIYMIHAALTVVVFSLAQKYIVGFSGFPRFPTFKG